jgi:hypothetical protein
MVTERPARIHLDGWAGRSADQVVVVGETPKRYRIRTAGDKAVRLAGRNRYLSPGETVLVPKAAISFDLSEVDSVTGERLRAMEIRALAERWWAYHPSNAWQRRDEDGDLHEASVWTTEGWVVVPDLTDKDRESMLAWVREAMDQVPPVSISFHHGILPGGGAVVADTPPVCSFDREAIAGHVANVLTLGDGAAWALCEAAGWPS